MAPKKYWITKTFKVTITMASKGGTNLYYGKNTSRDATITYDNQMNRWRSDAEITSAFMTFESAVVYSKLGWNLNVQESGDDGLSMFSGFFQRDGSGEWQRMSDVGKEGEYHIGISNPNRNAGLKAFLNYAKNGKGGALKVEITAAGANPGNVHILDLHTNQSGDQYKIRIYVTCRYDPKWDYDKSEWSLTKSLATACDVNYPEKITDDNLIKLHFITGLFDSHIKHVVTFYTMKDGQRLTITDENNQERSTDVVVTVPYSQGVNVSFPVPDYWCWAWPNNVVGVGYFEVETFYTYSKLNASDTPPTESLGVSQQGFFTVNVPLYIKPSITQASFYPVPTALPWAGGGTNEISEQWISQDIYMQNYVGLHLDVVEGSGSFGSTIMQYVFVENTYRTASWQIGEQRIGNDGGASLQLNRVTMAGDLSFTVYAKDSRGRNSDVFYMTVADGYRFDVVEVQDFEGNVQYTYQTIPVETYVTPSFDYARSHRINHDGDATEDGIYLNAEAYAIISAVVDPRTGVNENVPYMYCQYRQKNAAAEWLPAYTPPTEFADEDHAWSGVGIALTQGGSSDYKEATIDPTLEYEVRYVLYDVMTDYLEKEYYNYLKAIEEDAPLPGQYACKQTKDVGSTDCTIFIKRDGFGIGVGMQTETARNYRCIEINPSWEIRHGRDGDTIYYIPDVIFTSANDPRQPRKKKGRLWLHEIG